MKINTLLQKPVWRRKLPPTNIGKNNGTGIPMQNISANSGNWTLLTQEDFMNELTPSAHLINSTQYKVPRPKFKFDKTTKKYKITKWEDGEHVNVGLENIALRSATTHTFAGDFKFSNEGDEANGELVRNIQSYWFRTGMREAIMDTGYNFLGSGDAAIYIYRVGNRIKYKVFSYLYGDIIAKPNSKTFIRKTSLYNKDIIEIYTDKSIDIWVHKDTLKSEYWEYINMELEASGSILETSEDDYVKVKYTPHTWGICPVIYHREEDVTWGKGVSTRERIEKLLSYWADNNNISAFPIYWFNSQIVNLPDMGAAGKVLGLGKDGKAGVIAPSDVSTSFTLDLDKNLKMYCDSLGIVIIDPKDLKGGGETSGTYVQNLYFPAVQEAEIRIAKLRDFFNDVIDLFSKIVGNIKGETLKYSTVELSYFLNPFIPHSVMEDITIVNQCVNAGTTSMETGAELIDHNSPREKERLNREAREKLTLEAEFKKKENTDNGGDGSLKDTTDNRMKNKKDNE